MNPPGAPLLRLECVSRAYGRLRALHRVSMEVHQGDSIALFGPNGAGKSTLLRILSTLLTPSAGQIVYRGNTLDRKSKASYRQHLGLVGHTSFLYDELSARENLLLHARLRGVKTPGQRADDLLLQVGLASRSADRVSQFSRGMEQRLSLARALVSSPDLLLLDEPFTGLDAGGKQILQGVLESHQQAGRTTILVSHDLSLGLALADRFMVLDRGEVSCMGSSIPWRGVPREKISLAKLKEQSQ